MSAMILQKPIQRLKTNHNWDLDYLYQAIDGFMAEGAARTGVVFRGEHEIAMLAFGRSMSACCLILRKPCRCRCKTNS